MLVEFVVKAGVVIIGLHLFSFILISWIALVDTIDDDYEYCHNCKYGMCTETPYSDKCQKWKEQQNENQNM